MKPRRSRRRIVPKCDLSPLNAGLARGPRMDFTHIRLVEVTRMECHEGAKPQVAPNDYHESRAAAGLADTARARLERAVSLSYWNLWTVHKCSCKTFLQCNDGSWPGRREDSGDLYSTKHVSRRHSSRAFGSGCLSRRAQLGLTSMRGGSRCRGTN